MLDYLGREKPLLGIVFGADVECPRRSEGEESWTFDVVVSKPESKVVILIEIAIV